MSCLISGYTQLTDSSLGVVAWTAQKYVYLQPSRDDFEYLDASGNWKSWVGDPDITAYKGAIKAAVNMSTGAWAFTVPWSDNEVKFSLLSSAPSLVWNIIDPNITGGTKVYYGPTLQAIVGGSKTLKELLLLASPDTWTATAANYTGYPNGPRRQVSVTFNAGVSAQTASWPTIGYSTWRFSHGIRTDDTNTYAVKVDKGSETDTGCTLTLSQAPPVGKSVQVDLEIW